MDEQARKQIREDLDHTYLVEAGAGTGKTTLLVARILHIIRTASATLPQIVAITFTEKAAQELKNRLKEKLESEIETQTDFQVQKLFSQALRELEYSSITTIHGFCNSILREKAVEAQVDIGFNVVSESSANSLYEAAWEEWILCKIKDKEEFLRDLLRLGISFEQMQKTAMLLSKHQDLAQEYFHPKMQLFSFESWKQYFNNSITELEMLSSSCQNKEDRGYQRILALSNEWNFIKDLPEKDVVRRIIYGIEVKSEGNKKNWNPGDTLSDIKEKLKALKEVCETLALVAKHNLTQRFLAWLKQFLEDYQKQKEQKNMLTFEDLLIYTRNMLQKNKEVRKELQQRYRYILVDEFQDTDPLQTEILFFLSEKEPIAEEWQQVCLEEGKFFAVGDPKQAIYRFRRADIEIYESVKAKLGKERFLEIQKNFRSSCGILDWVNHVFSHLIQPPENGAYQPKYSNLYAHRTNMPKDKSVYYLSLPNKKSSSEEESLKMDEIIEEESESIARMISLVVREKWPVVQNNAFQDAQYGDIAILLRRLSYVESFEKALTRYGIPYQVIGSKSYYSRVEIKSLIVLLLALLEPYNEIRVAGALRSPVFSVSDEEIFLYKHQHGTLDYRDTKESESHIGQVFSLLRELHHKRFTLSISLFLQEVFEKTGLLLTFMGMSKGENRVANLLKILQLSYSFS
ncbi:MAG: UvrD-helicase domain-containing protein, partial [Candidatus Brocadiae bacterium]|nr:UvrD-helicase domain-containing protein [Candidatus Brocadiia bacterium]